jgi:hypothetical protein
MSAGRIWIFNVIVVIFCILLIVPMLAATVTAQTSGNLPRGSRFTVSITGQPNTLYFVWDAGTFSMSGAAGDQPPVIAGGTLNLQKDPPGGPYEIGMHPTSSGGTILDDVAPSNGDFSNTDYYATVTTDADGQALVEFLTSSNTATRHFAIKVEDLGGNPGQLQVQANLFARTTPPTSVIPTAIVTTQITTLQTPLPTPLPSLAENPAVVPTTISVPITTGPVTQTRTPLGPIPIGIVIGAVVICLIGFRKK